LKTALLARLRITDTQRRSICKMLLLSETIFEMSHYPRELMVDKHEPICETTITPLREGKDGSARADLSLISEEK
jgi:hypothetical protein